MLDVDNKCLLGSETFQMMKWVAIEVVRDKVPTMKVIWINISLNDSYNQWYRQSEKCQNRYRIG